jgi:hypothetical protein
LKIVIPEREQGDYPLKALNSGESTGIDPLKTPYSGGSRGIYPPENQQNFAAFRPGLMHPSNYSSSAK